MTTSYCCGNYTADTLLLLHLTYTCSSYTPEQMNSDNNIMFSLENSIYGAEIHQ
uniref:Uncharacterized protein n=1 Tax=Picea glauca TaxID=3330 RepID=A0A101LU05_PICGL|nr:hypothetical protein ABT39_MTgene3402 [Picea glauca]